MVQTALKNLPGFIISCILDLSHAQKAIWSSDSYVASSTDKDDPYLAIQPDGNIILHKNIDGDPIWWPKYPASSYYKITNSTIENHNMWVFQKGPYSLELEGQALTVFKIIRKESPIIVEKLYTLKTQAYQPQASFLNKGSLGSIVKKTQTPKSGELRANFNPNVSLDIEDYQSGWTNRWVMAAQYPANQNASTSRARYMLLQSDGNVVIIGNSTDWVTQQKNDYVEWWSPTYPVKARFNKPAELDQDNIWVGKSCISGSCHYSAIQMHNDGTLWQYSLRMKSTYADKAQLPHMPNPQTGVYHAVLQSDGNFVIYDTKGARWSLNNNKYIGANDYLDFNQGNEDFELAEVEGNINMNLYDLTSGHAVS